MALIEDRPIRVSMFLDDPLERLVRQSTASIVDVQTLPCYYAGGDFRFKAPAEAAVSTATTQGVAMETNGEAALVFPPDASLVAALMKAAREPESYPEPFNLVLSSHTIGLSQSVGPEGEALISAQMDPLSENASWLSTAALLYRLRWNGRDESVILVGRVFGGLGRLAWALKQERGEGPLVGVARGGLFWQALPNRSPQELLGQLQGMGLRYSAVGAAEIRHWDDLMAYRASRPDGVQFLSANVVYSSNTATSVLPAAAFVSTGGLRVAIVGLTMPSAAKFLGQSGLAGVTIQSPELALRGRLVSLRAQADVIAIIGDLDDETTAALQQLGGVDLLLARSVFQQRDRVPPERSAIQRGRAPFDPPLWAMQAPEVSLSVLDVAVSSGDGAADWRVRERHARLADSTPEQAGFDTFDPERYGISLSTDPALIPSARRLFASSAEGPQRQLSPRDFWTLAASLAADETGAEVALLRVLPLYVQVAGDVKERVARIWLNTEEAAVATTLRGSELRPLLAEAQRQRDLENAHQPSNPPVRYTAGGVETGPKIDGAPLDDNLEYRVTTSRVLADALGLSAGHKITPLGRTVGDVALTGLRSRAGADPDVVRGWTEGRPVARRGLWRINFRDVGINLQKTQVVRGDDFNSVPNARIQGFDEVDVGETFKADAEYLRDPFRWTNTLEMEYTRSDLRPRGQPPVTNVTANRIMLLTMGTRRAGAIATKWLAQSWGPSLGLQFDSEFEPQPGLRRKQIYSAYPGVQFYDGTWIKSLEASANIKRDLSRVPPNTQTGLHGRVLVARDIATAANGPISLQGELYSNYFFLTHSDTIQDLRVEGDANLKLRIPFRKYLSIAPFVDIYWFALKVQPEWGYSLMTGIQIGFSRLWKPQFQPLFGER